jgi:hypothetical protein
MSRKFKYQRQVQAIKSDKRLLVELKAINTLKESSSTLGTNLVCLLYIYLHMARLIIAINFPNNRHQFRVK